VQIRAQYRVDDRQPVFVTVFAPADIPLVRLKPGDDDDNDDRNLKISSGSFMPYGVASGRASATRTGSTWRRRRTLAATTGSSPARL
jgi:hypothetical protein